MTKITTDFVGTEDSSVRLSRLQQITDFYFGSGAFTGASNLGGVRGLLNSVSPVSIANGDFFGTWLLPVNVLNDPDALIAEYLTGLNGAWSGQLDPALGRLFLDEAGTTPATGPNQVIRRVNHRAGTISHVTFASGQAPILGRHPTSGVRNRANGSAAVGDAAFWIASQANNGVTITKLASGVDANGPWARYSVVGTATATSLIAPYVSPNSRAPAAVGQTWTTSLRAQRVAGSAPPADCGVRVEVNDETAPSTVLATGISAPFASDTAAFVSHTRTLATGGTNQARGSIIIRTENGATVDYEIVVQALQFEQGSTRTAYQTNLSKFDITEAPFADCWYLEPDGLDDFGTFSAAFAPAGAYTLAAAVNVPGGVLTPIFGRSTGEAALFGFGGSNRPVIQFGAANRRIWQPPLTGRQTLIARVRGVADYDARRSGIDLDEAVADALGDIFPAAEVATALCRDGLSYAPAGTRLYAYFLADANQPDARRNALERVLTSYNGVTLP
jgi:hypothetical protein